MAKPVEEKQEGAATAKPAPASVYADFAEAMAANPLLAQSTAAMAAATAVGMSIAGQFAGAFFGALQGALEAQNRMAGSPARAPESPQEPKAEEVASPSVATPAQTAGQARKSASGDRSVEAASKPVEKKQGREKPAAKDGARKASTAKPKAVAGDDLKRIAGIGPKLEKVLNGQGITSLGQIAAWKDADVAKFDEALGLDGRIGRDDWVGQARKLAK